MEVLDRFELSRWDGARGLARCPGPGHGDRHPSLSIARTADGRWLIFCFAGCRTDAVLAAVGLGYRDLFPHEAGAHGRRAVAAPREALAEVLARERRAQARLAPYLMAYMLADRVRDVEVAVRDLRRLASLVGDTEVGWELAADAAAVARDVQLDELAYHAALEAAGRR